MPLPIRDLSALHVSLNPVLADVHKLFPLSKYAPPVAMFKLFKLATENIPLMAFFDECTWMTMACLDDYSADHCIGMMTYAMSTGANKATINAMFQHLAAPFLVPMFAPAWWTLAGHGPSPRPPPPPRQQDMARAPHIVTANPTHVSESTARSDTARSDTSPPPVTSKSPPATSPPATSPPATSPPVTSPPATSPPAKSHDTDTSATAVTNSAKAAADAALARVFPTPIPWPPPS